MKELFEGWRRHLREGKTTKWAPGPDTGQWIRSGPMLDKTSEKNIIGGREAQESGVNIIDFDPPAARNVAQQLADKLGCTTWKRTWSRLYGYCL